MHTASLDRSRLEKLNQLLSEVWGANRFYARRWRQAGAIAAPIPSLEALPSYPLITRDELFDDQKQVPPLGTNLTGPFEELKRFHRSSGTTGAPILWADSAGSWNWVMQCSQALWRLAGVGPQNRVLFLMPFGAASGPWIIFEGACRLGCACLPSGDAPDEQLSRLTGFKPDVLAAKPDVLESLALNATASGQSPRTLGVRKLILCGRHGAGLRASLEDLWGAECFDRYGLTEAGSVAAECTRHPGGLHLLDDEFIAEAIDPDTGAVVPDGEPGELVLTTLGRLARPIIRYRTGDQVRLVRQCECTCGRRGAMLVGGVTRRGTDAAPR